MFRSTLMVVLVLAFGAALHAQESGALRASQLMRMGVRSAGDDVVGDVRDFVLDRKTGGFAYAVVALRLPGKGGKLFAVPWQALAPTEDRAALVLSVPTEALADVPGFDANSWPDMTDRRWAAKVDAAYGLGVPPRFVEADDEPRVIGVSETVAGAPRTSRETRASRAHAVVSGTVKSMEPGHPSQVVIATAYGDVYAALAPISYLEEQRLSFEVNANVRVRGYSTATVDGPVFVAVEAMTHPGRWVRLRNDDLTPAWSDAPGAPGEVRYLAGVVESVGSGFATVLTDTEGRRIVAMAPWNYFESRHWRLRHDNVVGVTGYDDPLTRHFVAITIDHANETWRVRRDDGTPLWR